MIPSLTSSIERLDVHARRSLRSPNRNVVWRIVHLVGCSIESRCPVVVDEHPPRSRPAALEPTRRSPRRHPGRSVGGSPGAKPWSGGAGRDDREWGRGPARRRRRRCRYGTSPRIAPPSCCTNSSSSPSSSRSIAMNGHAIQLAADRAELDIDLPVAGQVDPEDVRGACRPAGIRRRRSSSSRGTPCPRARPHRSRGRRLPPHRRPAAARCRQGNPSRCRPLSVRQRRR